MLACAVHPRWRRMLTLALDTATRWGRFAVADADGVLAYRPLNVGGSYADALLAVIADTLAGAGRDRRDLAAVAVTCGPGSFTGVRIGVATAKALAWGLGCALYPVSTLAAMAAALLADHPAVDLAVPALDARRGEIFSAVYRRDGGWVQDVAAPAAGTPDRWWGQVFGESRRSRPAGLRRRGRGFASGPGADAATGTCGPRGARAAALVRGAPRHRAARWLWRSREGWWRPPTRSPWRPPTCAFRMPS